MTISKLWPRTIRPEGKPNEEADHVIGVDFARAAFYVKATHALGGDKVLTVGVYAHREAQARKLLDGEGFTVQSIEQVAYL